ncbi:MAG: divalent-cation tolerance protein CutA [Parachlamydiaceae bacterium]
MSELIEIHWTSGSIDEARKVSRYLVQEGYVACAQIVPWIESIYLWNGQLETTQESKVSLKTHRDFFDTIKKVIQENCSYQVPEITFQHVDGGNEEYLQWAETTLRKKSQ